MKFLATYTYENSEGLIMKYDYIHSYDKSDVEIISIINSDDMDLLRKFFTKEIEVMVEDFKKLLMVEIHKK